MTEILKTLDKVFRASKDKLPETIKTAWPFPVGEKPAAMKVLDKVQRAEDIERVNLMDEAIEQEIKLCHAFDYNDHYGGVTIAWRKMTDLENGRMVEVAVSYCSKHDAFNKKVGNVLAVSRFMAGHTIMVPAGIEGDDNIPAILRNMFWYSITE